MVRFRRELGPAKSNGQINEERIRELSRYGDFRAYWLEFKFDGSRYLLHLFKKGHHLTSRRVSVVTKRFVEKIHQVRHFKKLKISKKLEGCVIDGEVVSQSHKLNGPGGVGGILNSLPDRAREKQKKYGQLMMMCFDLLVDCKLKSAIKDMGHGKPLFDRSKLRIKYPLSKRRKRLEEILKEIWRLNPGSEKFIKLSPITRIDSYKDFVRTYSDSLSRGYEGVMVKDGREPIGKGMFKVKIYRDVCVIVTGYKKGKGKYKGQVGSIKFSVYKKKGGGKLIEIGKCGGFTDKLRLKISKKRKKYLGRVLEVKAQEMGANGRLRHPRFSRFRSDYNEFDCTLKKVKKDLDLNIPFIQKLIKVKEGKSGLKKKRRRKIT